MTKRKKLETRTGNFEYWINSKKVTIINLDNDLEYSIPNRKFNKSVIEESDVINWVNINILNLPPCNIEEEQSNTRKLSIYNISDKSIEEKEYLYGYSPLFDPIQEVDNIHGYMHRLSIKNGYISIYKEYYSELSKVRDISEAEYRVLSNIQISTQTPIHNLMNTIIKTAREISEDIKRPADKIVLLNPDIVVDLLNSKSTIEKVLPFDDMKNQDNKSIRYTGNRYKFEANLLPGQNIRIYSNDMIPLNEVFIIHNDSMIDKGAFLVRNKTSDCLRLYKSEDMKQKIKKIKII